MFDSKMTQDLSTILNWGRKHFSIKTIGAFGVFIKDVLAIFANGLTSGLPFDNWDQDEKLHALIDKSIESGDAFFALFEEETNV